MHAVKAAHYIGVYIDVRTIHVSQRFSLCEYANRPCEQSTLANEFEIRVSTRVDMQTNVFIIKVALSNVDCTCTGSLL